MDATTKEIKELLRHAIPTPAAKREPESRYRAATFSDVMKVAHRINRAAGRDYTIGCNCQSCKSHTRKAA